MSENRKPEITAPVTDDLLAVLAESEEMVKDFACEKVNGEPPSDRAHYTWAVLQVEKLVKVTVHAQVSGSLLSLASGGARFSVQGHGPLMAALDDAVMYLRGDAANLLKHGSDHLSKYHRVHLDNALDLLKKLVGLLLDGIRLQADNDLRKIKGLGARHLVATAQLLSEIAKGKVPASELLPPEGDKDPFDLS